MGFQKYVPTITVTTFFGHTTECMRSVDFLNSLLTPPVVRMRASQADGRRFDACCGLNIFICKPDFKVDTVRFFVVYFQSVSVFFDVFILKNRFSRPQIVPLDIFHPLHAMKISLKAFLSIFMRLCTF